MLPSRKFYDVQILPTAAPSSKQNAPPAKWSSSIHNELLHWPRSNWVSHSAVKVEKVVKLPKNPVISMSFQNSGSLKVSATPMQKQPIKLAANVPKGRAFRLLLFSHRLSRQRSNAPLVAPMAMASIEERFIFKQLRWIVRNVFG